MSLSPASLPIGGSRTGIRINSRAKWNRTGVLVAPNERYRLTAEGRWFDLGIGCDADGFPSARASLTSGLLRRFEAKRRMPAELWFCLIGAVGEDLTTAFRIGKKREEWIVSTMFEGPLLCFANDVPSAYWNNFGSVFLTVQRCA